MTCDLVQNPGCDVETTEDKDKIDFLSEELLGVRDAQTSKTSRTTSSTVAVISRIGIQMRGVAKGAAWLSGCRNFEDVFHGRIQDWRNSNQNYISGERSYLMSGMKKLPRPRTASRTISDVSRIGIQMAEGFQKLLCEFDEISSAKGRIIRMHQEHQHVPIF